VVAAQERWPPLMVSTLETKLDELIALVGKDSDELPEEARAWLARLLVVRACGYIEQTALEAQRAHVVAKSGGRVRSFALSWLDKSSNPSPERLAEGLGRFDGGLRDEFNSFLDDDDQRLYRELHFLLDRRNKIAHGLNEGITPTRALALARISKEIADWLVLRLRP